MSKPNMGYHAQRMRFSIGRTERTKLFKEIEGHNSRLKELLDTSDEITEIHRKRNPAGLNVAKAFNKFWTHASRIFRLLSESWRCDCLSKHHAHLLLEQRASPEVRFNLTFLFDEKRSESHTPTWNWLDTRIALTDKVTLIQPKALPPTEDSSSGLSVKGSTNSAEPLRLQSIKSHSLESAKSMYGNSH
jgi:hypothetical protein